MPAAAVIPAPVAYIKVVAVEKLVVGFLAWNGWPATIVVRAGSIQPSFRGPPLPFIGSGVGTRIDYFEKIRVFKAGVCLEYISME